MNIDYTSSLQEIAAITDIWCGVDASAGALVSAADVALRARALRVAVQPLHVHIMWSWMEGKDTEVFAAFQEQDVRLADPAKLSAEIHAAFKKGAGGVILPGSARIIAALLPVRDDLFFGKKLFISLDLKNIGPNEWPDVFNDLKKIQVDGVLLDARRGDGKSRSLDAVGKSYGFLENCGKGFSASVSLLASSPDVMESVWRLACKMRPEVAKNMRFFVSNQ
jgi:hypothetical protein